MRNGIVFIGWSRNKDLAIALKKSWMKVAISE